MNVAFADNQVIAAWSRSEEEWRLCPIYDADQVTVLGPSRNQAHVTIFRDSKSPPSVYEGSPILSYDVQEVMPIPPIFAL